MKKESHHIDLLNGHIFPSLTGLALPIMATSLVQTAYNLTDMAWIGRVGSHAVTAVGAAGMYTWFSSGIVMLAKMGGQVKVAHSLGKQQREEARVYGRGALQLTVLLALAFALIVNLCADPLIGFFLLESAGTAQAAKVYLRITCGLILFPFLNQTLTGLFTAVGDSKTPFLANCIGLAMNMILDPILIFGMFGMPKMGVAGAALATVIGQFIAAGLALFFNLKVNHDIKFDWKNMLPTKFVLFHIYKVAVPSILMVSIGSVMMFCMNRILEVFTTTAIAVFGVYFKLQSFIFMPIFGMNNGMVPIIAYNYGARHRDRIIGTIKLAVMYAVAMMLIGFAVFQIIPDKLLLMFNASDNMLAIGVPALRLISISFLLAGFNIICSSVFQAMGNGVFSLIVSVIRQLVVLVPVAFLISKMGVLDRIWWSFPIAEVVAAAICVFFLRKILKMLNF